MSKLPSWLITLVAARSHQLLGEAFAEAGARPYHYRLLAALEEFGPSSQATLGKRTGIDRSDVVGALNEMADSGFVRRAPDPDDRRQNIVTVMPKGIERLHVLDRIVEAVQKELLAPLSAADRKEFVRLLFLLSESCARTR